MNATESEQKGGQDRADPGENISIDRIESPSIHETNRPIHGLFGKQPTLSDDPPFRINQRTDTSIGSPGNEDPILYGPEGSQGEVLIGSGGLSEPRVVRDRHQKIGSLFHKSSAEIWEDDFETDEDPKLPLRKGEVEEFLPGFEVPYPLT